MCRRFSREQRSKWVGEFKSSGLGQAIESVGAKLFYLPPYSLNFNPIELAFSKLQKSRPKAAIEKDEFETEAF